MIVHRHPDVEWAWDAGFLKKKPNKANSQELG
jgi:hypothetical protein